MTDKRKYNKMLSKHKKRLKKLAKEAHPFDYGLLLDFIKEQLEFMRDYYKLGYNVWARELSESEENSEDFPYTRLEGIQKTLDELEAYNNCEDKYFIYHETGGIANGKGGSYAVIDNDGSEKIIKCDSWIEHLLPDDIENKNAFLKEKEEHWDKFFELLKSHMREWWD